MKKYSASLYQFEIFSACFGCYFFILIEKTRILILQNLMFYNLNFRLMTSNISPFIEKLQQILSDPMNSDILVFSESNSKLEILSKKKLENILPKYFRHNKFQSFVRQLNWYGFYKVNNKSVNCYSHPDLEKGVKLSEIKSRRKNIAWKKPVERKSEEQVVQEQDQIVDDQNRNKNLTLFVPLQNRMIYNPVSMENRSIQYEPMKTFIFGGMQPSYPLYFSLDNNFFVPFL